MDLDPLEMVVEPSAFEDTASDVAHRRRARLNAAVAITVALLATFMGICKIKDDNICQAMQQAQADKIDHWSYYQARNVRQEIAEATATQLRLQQPSSPAPRKRAMPRRSPGTTSWPRTRDRRSRMSWRRPRPTRRPTTP